MKKGKTHGLARVILAFLMCIIIILTSIFIVMPVKIEKSIQYSVFTEEKTFTKSETRTEIKTQKRGKMIQTAKKIKTTNHAANSDLLFLLKSNFFKLSDFFAPFFKNLIFLRCCKF